MIFRCKMGENAGLQVQFCDVVVGPGDPLDAVQAILSCLYPGFRQLEKPSKQLEIEELTGGYNNKMFLVTGLDDQIIFRIYADLMERMFDREQELAYLLFLHEHGLYEKIYGTFRNGICYRYRRGHCLPAKEKWEPKMAERIADKIAQMHAVSLTSFPGQKKRNIADAIRNYWKNIPDAFSDSAKGGQIRGFFPDIPALRKECFELLSIIETLPISGPLVLCHYDLSGANILYDEVKDCVNLIDFEFAEFGYQADEIGHFLSEFTGSDVDNTDKAKHPDVSFQLGWIRTYLLAFNRFTGRVSSLVSEDEVWNFYILSKKLALLKPWFCFAWIVRFIVQKETPNEPDKIQEDVEDLKFARNMLSGYYQAKDVVIALQPRNLAHLPIDHFK